MSNLSKEEVEHIALLARIKLDETMLTAMTGQLNQILGYMEKLSEVDTSGVAPTTHVLHLFNAFRQDRVLPSLDRKAALASAPEQGGGAFIVPKII